MANQSGNGLISLQQMIDALSSLPTRHVKLDENQRKIVVHGEGPLWIIAGPGSGKTEVLVLRCLKLLLVDGVDPKSIIFTTFTEKAARSLQDRLTNYKLHIAKTHPEVGKVDHSQLRVGTLHSLCNSIMIETRYPAYKSYRPLDELEQLMFIYFHSDLATTGASKLSAGEIEFWRRFEYAWATTWRARAFSKKSWSPTRWMRARACQLMFNRIVEDHVDIDKMKARGEEWERLAESYLQYKSALESSFRVDFPHMQSKFLEFLASPLGKQFMEGGGGQPGISHALVDEYQDTNPVQEAIYLQLAKRKPHNICVVGDDDQALYRFRGGTVECMINFDKACKREFGIRPQPIPLVQNYRSHPTIVQWVNDYIRSFRTMHKPGARVPNKPQLVVGSSISGDWPAVALLAGSDVQEVAERFGDTMVGLMSNRIINRPSECVLLLRSTRESRWYAGYFAEALRRRDVPLYNPRARQFLGQEEIELALGAFLEIVDRRASTVPVAVREACGRWRKFYKDQITQYDGLAKYVVESQRKISSLPPNTPLEGTAQDIIYHILSHPPFTDWLEDPEKTLRLGELTRLMEAFSSSPIPGYPGLSRGFLRTSRTQAGEISWSWRQQLYYSFITLIVEEGLNDPEDEEVICPHDMMPFMTVHQAKGLEFPFVFVTKLDDAARADYQHIMEEEFMPFRRTPVDLPSADERAKQDLIRFFYVAYSRAKHALILMTTDKSIRPGEDEFVAFGGQDVKWFKKHVRTLS